jgi:putative heme transporter
VLVAVANSGIAAGVVMLVVVLVANLGVENLVDPVVTGRTLDIHPLLVLLVTVAGGVLGGIVGVVLAVPLTVIAGRVLVRAAPRLGIDTAGIRDAVERTIGDTT